MTHAFKTVSIIGLGYIGLPTAAMFASRKINVVGVDISKQVVNTINKGQIHIIEPKLDIIVSAAIKQGYLRATTKAEPADAFLIAVPTPFIGDHEPDLSFIEAATKSIAPILKKGDLIILESTSPVGTTEQMAEWLAQARPDLWFPQHRGENADINIAYCPERVLPGNVVHELVANDRVIGGMTSVCSQRAVLLYEIFVQGECIKTSVRTAEMCKLIENSFRDVNIAFANEISMICDKLEINVWELIKIANRHPRVDILQPGPGVGGHCIAVDPWFLVNKTPEYAKIINTARQVNDGKPEWVIEKFKSFLNDFINKNPLKIAKEIAVACFGIVFKPDIDDIRESPSLNIVNNLAQVHDGPLYIIEPNIIKLPISLEERTELISIEDAMVKGDILIFLVAHKEFKKIDFNVLDKTYVMDICGIKQYI
jgi:UDP-N-acetyl-D-mannosaminuronic acid dehydrogenase